MGVSTALFSTAQERCQEIGGDLPFFNDEQELDAYNAVRCHRTEWVGIELTNGSTWTNMNGVESTVLNWGSEQPSRGEDCVYSSNWFSTNQEKEVSFGRPIILLYLTYRPMKTLVPKTTSFSWFCPVFA